MAAREILILLVLVQVQVEQFGKNLFSSLAKTYLTVWLRFIKKYLWAGSSIGRAFGLHPKSWEFDSPPRPLMENIYRVWVNLVDHSVWDRGYAGSNPVTLTFLEI